MKTAPLRTSQKNVEEPTKRDILEALFVFSDKVDVQLADVRKEMREGFAGVRKEIQDVRSEMEQGFTDVRSEIRSIWKSLEEIKEDLKKLQKTAIEDSDAQGKSIVVLSEKIEKLEKRLKKLELQKVAR